jgi:hypothetical protein
MNTSLAALKEAVEIKEQIASLETRLSKILGGTHAPVESAAPAKRGPKTMSAAARAKISAAAKARWAKIKGTSSKPAKKTTKGFSAAHRAKLVAAAKARWAKIKGTSTPAKKKRHLSAEGRAAIVAALKKRWALKKGK